MNIKLSLDACCFSSLPGVQISPWTKLAVSPALASLEMLL